MPTIEIDQEVFEFLEQNAQPFVDTNPNDVLRRLLLGDRTIGEKKEFSKGEKQNNKLDTDSFVRQALFKRFGGGFSRVGRFRYMFESAEWLVYFQNFNKKNTTNLWYRLHGSALQEMILSTKNQALCFTNPAEGIMYVIPIEKVMEKAKDKGWDHDDLEVNIDPSNDRWREMDWDLSEYLEKI